MYFILSLKRYEKLFINKEISLSEQRRNKPHWPQSMCIRLSQTAGNFFPVIKLQPGIYLNIKPKKKKPITLISLIYLVKFSELS